MDVSKEVTAKAAALAEDPDPLKHQHLRERGRSNNPVLVYDRDQKTLQVRSKKNVGQYFNPSIELARELMCINLESGDIYQEVKLPARKSLVTLFVDEETESKLTTQRTGKDGQSNILLAQLHLDRLPPYGQVFRFFGLLSTLYVMGKGPLSETSSQTC